MNQIEILVKQTKDAYEWTNKVISSIPQDKWDNIPKIIESNVSWQVGHLIMSFYYHSIMVIKGHQMDILQKIPMKEYDVYFTDASPNKALGKTDPVDLQNNLMFVQARSMEIIASLSEKDLRSELEGTLVPHPIATNKFEALDWNIKHTMWHCGQLGILKRIVHERYNFGLKAGK
ncbi:DinB family protein [Sphingobacterium gobiense]|uniref:DinB family protein n=1 Tax=Sphingobacterium gobiense TaxID=1382456 RepID=A0A2S9JUV6_9SPHI|nr:DinB family protein [Sphingobacterium gobiense]PRD57065.1 DinB family protein [Sphingobacterium gobiense]